MSSSERSPEIALTSLAILKVNWDTHQRDYIGNFVPFVAECLKDMAQDEVSLEVRQAAETPTRPARSNNCNR